MSAATEPKAPSKALIWVGRIMSTIPVLLLTMSACMKIARPPMVIEGFEKAGYPTDILLGLGIVELVCTILYVIPQTAVLGAVLVTGYFGGAIATHVRQSEPYFLIVILGMMVWGGLYFRDKRIRDLLPFRKLS